MPDPNRLTFRERNKLCDLLDTVLVRVGDTEPAEYTYLSGVTDKFIAADFGRTVGKTLKPSLIAFMRVSEFGKFPGTLRKVTKSAPPPEILDMLATLETRQQTSEQKLNLMMKSLSELEEHQQNVLGHAERLQAVIVRVQHLEHARNHKEKA